MNTLQDKLLTAALLLQLRWLIVVQVQVITDITVETNWGLTHEIQTKQLNMNKLRD